MSRAKDQKEPGSALEIDRSELVATKVWDTSLFKRLLNYARPHRRLFVRSFAVLSLLFAGELLGTLIWKGNYEFLETISIFDNII